MGTVHGSVLPNFFFFFSTFHGLSHERYSDNIGSCCPIFFFFQKEHNTLMDGAYKFINFNLLPSMDVFCSFWTPKNAGIYKKNKALWHLYITTLAFIQNQTLWHLYITTLAFIQNQTLWHLYITTLAFIQNQTLWHLYRKGLFG